MKPKTRCVSFHVASLGWELVERRAEVLFQGNSSPAFGPVSSWQFKGSYALDPVWSVGKV